MVVVRAYLYIVQPLLVFAVSNLVSSLLTSGLLNEGDSEEAWDFIRAPSSALLEAMFVRGKSEAFPTLGVFTEVAGSVSVERINRGQHLMVICGLHKGVVKYSSRLANLYYRVLFICALRRHVLVTITENAHSSQSLDRSNIDSWIDFRQLFFLRARELGLEDALEVNRALVCLPLLSLFENVTLIPRPVTCSAEGLWACAAYS